jgi:hypothetical protein
VYERWWLPLAEVLHFKPADVLDLTLGEFTQAVTYTEGRLSNGGQRQA